VSHDDRGQYQLGDGATILNIAKIRIKNDTMVMVSDLPSKCMMYGQIRNKRNIMNMKVSEQRASYPTIERGDPLMV
jgi:hypothetical protein